MQSRDTLRGSVQGVTLHVVATLAYCISFRTTHPGEGMERRLTSTGLIISNYIYLV